MTERLGWDSYFLGIAEAVAERADCTRRKVGAVIFDNDYVIVSTGYNGVRPGAPGCLAGACPRGRLSYEEVKELTDYSNPDSPGYCISSHAERSAQHFAKGSCVGFNMAVTFQPCSACTKDLYNAGFKRIIFGSPSNYETWKWN